MSALYVSSVKCMSLFCVYFCTCSCLHVSLLGLSSPCHMMVKVSSHFTVLTFNLPELFHSNHFPLFPLPLLLLFLLHSSFFPLSAVVSPLPRSPPTRWLRTGKQILVQTLQPWASHFCLPHFSHLLCRGGVSLSFMT